MAESDEWDVYARKLANHRDKSKKPNKKMRNIEFDDDDDDDDDF